MDDMHEIVADLKRVASEMGRSPTFQEYLDAGKFSQHKIRKVFKQFSVLVKAAGLDMANARSIGNVNRNDVVRARVQKYMSHDLSGIPLAAEPIPTGVPDYTTVIAIPDMHLPFWNATSIGKIYSLIAKLKPEYVIQLGDLYDFYSFSKFPRSHLIVKPDEEIALGRAMAEEFWKTIRHQAPKAKCVQLLGNHDIRPHRRVLESNSPELEVFFDYKKWFQFDGVETIFDSRAVYEVGRIGFHHGYKTGRGKHRRDTGLNMVHGHTHEPYLLWDHLATERWDRGLWEMSCGYVGNPESKVFNFTATQFRKWKQAVGYISKYGPVLVDLE